MFLGLIFAAVELAAPFADHMVLQRGTKVPVWGRAEPGESVEVRFADQVRTAVADAAGRWRVDLEPMSVGIYRGATGIDSWTPCDGTPERTKDRDDCQPSIFWNTVVNPWTPFAVRGMIWYQGEHDAGGFDRYTAKLHKLYGAWKTKFENPDLSFYYVQLCPWGGNIAKMQEAQARFEEEEPHAAMVVANDVCNLKDIRTGNLYNEANLPIGPFQTR